MRRVQPVPTGAVLAAFAAFVLLPHDAGVIAGCICLIVALLFLEVGPPDMPV